MNRKRHRSHATRLLALSILSTLAAVGCHAERPRSSTELVRYGGMHETIGLKHHEGRVGLAEVLGRPHFYGVGALAGLQGEITIHGSGATVTSVAPDGRLQAMSPADLQATLLMGQSIEHWTSRTLDEAVPHERFDEAISAAAAGAGLDVAVPFVFTIDSEFTDVRLHVIHGACPVHARMKKLELPEIERPFELEARTLAGTLVGIHATNSVGELTHPATRAHAHLIYTDPETGQRVTAHLERVGLAPGAVLQLPKTP